ncbi:MAG: DMT family transporter [Sciscionella sp.]
MSAQLLVAAVPAAVGASVAFGVSSVLQQRATREVADRKALRIGLLFDLLKRPAWLSSLLLDGVGGGLQVLALATASVALVQPLLVLSVLFAVLGAATFARRRPDPITVLAALCCVLGLGVFLGLARPTEGRSTVTLAEVLPLGVVLAVLLALSLVVGARSAGQRRALAWGAGCGILYGATAGLAKLVLGEFSGGLFAPLAHWPVYALAVVGIVGFLLNQNAFQASTAIGPVLSVITILDPVAAVVIGVVWLGEGVRGGVVVSIGEVAALAVMTASVVVLTYRSPHAALAEGAAASRGAPPHSATRRDG